MRALSLSPVIAAAALLCACGSGGDAPTPESLLAQLPAPYNGADFVHGRQVFVQCTACHTATKGGANMVGPNLYGVFGIKAGVQPETFAFSDALKNSGIVWDTASLDKWLTDPMAMVPGTKMSFIGVKDATDRRDLIGYLKVVTSGGPQ